MCGVFFTGRKAPKSGGVGADFGAAVEANSGGASSWKQVLIEPRLGKQAGAELGQALIKIFHGPARSPLNSKIQPANFAAKPRQMHPARSSCWPRNTSIWHFDNRSRRGHLLLRLSDYFGRQCYLKRLGVDDRLRIGRLEVVRYVIESPRFAFHLMNGHRPVDASPQILVFDRHHLAERFPLPIVFAPLFDAVQDAAADIFAGRNDRDSRRALKRLKSTNDAEQFQSLAVYVRLDVGRFDLVQPIDGLQHEAPIAAIAAGMRLAEQQKVGSGDFHTTDREMFRRTKTSLAAKQLRRQCPHCFASLPTLRLQATRGGNDLLASANRASASFTYLH